MKNKDVSFYGYNDGKAITIYNCICLFWPTFISIIISIALTITAVFTDYYYLLVFWILPLLFILVYILNFASTNYNDKVFLNGANKKHYFELVNSVLFKDGKEIKNKIKVFVFKNFIFLVLKKSYYRIPNNDFVGISRDEFLFNIKYNKFTHELKFVKKEELKHE